MTFNPRLSIATPTSPLPEKAAVCDRLTVI